jgi:hypothetical protein
MTSAGWLEVDEICLRAGGAAREAEHAELDPAANQAMARLIFKKKPHFEPRNWAEKQATATFATLEMHTLYDELDGTFASSQLPIRLAYSRNGSLLSSACFTIAECLN